MPLHEAPPWLTVARSYRGVNEVPGPRSHPTILQWAKNMGGWVAAFFKDDATPHCALALNAWLEEARLPMSGPAGSPALLRAASFVTYGRPLDFPCLGAILVFRKPATGQMHCTLYEGESIKAYRCFGSNQGNQTGSSWFPIRECIAIRWPQTSVRPGERLFLRPDSTPIETATR